MAGITSMKVLYTLPLSTTAPNDGVTFWRFVRFEYVRDNAWYRGTIEFKGVVAQRHRAESCSTRYHTAASDKLVEIENSDWLEEIYADTDESSRQYWWKEKKQKHHYMIYLREADSLEIIADSWELLPEEKGEWPEITLK